jgi:hypothetical protein
MTRTIFSKFYLLVAIACLTISVSAATHTETFGSLTDITADPVTGTSTISGFSWDDQYGGGGSYPDLVLEDNDSTDFEYASSDSKYLKQTGETDQALWVKGSGLSGTGNNILQYAFALRIDSLPVDNTDNTIDIVRLKRVQVLGSGDNLSGVVVTGGLMRFANVNGHTDSTISATAFDATSGSNLASFGWFVVAVRHEINLSGSGRTLSYLINPATGDVMESQVHENLTNVAADAVQLIAFGATWDVPIGNPSPSISIDDFSLYSDTDAPDADLFLLNVREDYTGLSFPASVENWMNY